MHGGTCAKPLSDQRRPVGDGRCAAYWCMAPGRPDNSLTMHRPRPSRHALRKRTGFTIIELMLVVAVASVLALVAFPSFMDSVRKGRRAEAVAALAQVQQAQERWRSNKASYADNAKLTAAPPNGLGITADTSSGLYALNIDAANASSYTATATATAGKSQAGDGSCQRLRVRVDRGNIVYGSAAGAGDFDESAGNRCWSR
jgi:type IV pilus assembly protein PilE